MTLAELEGFKTAASILAAVAMFAGVSFAISESRNSGVKAPDTMLVDGKPYSMPENGRQKAAVSMFDGAEAAGKPQEGWQRLHPAARAQPAPRIKTFLGRDVLDSVIGPTAARRRNSRRPIIRRLTPQRTAPRTDTASPSMASAILPPYKRPPGGSAAL